MAKKLRPEDIPQSAFARHLASVDIKNRNKALRALKIFFARNALITEDEFAPIWKGLFVTFWLSDKVAVQQELADRISKLVHSFTVSETCFLFIETFWDMLQREWANIDKFRLDKFYSFIRLFLRETFVWLHNRSWTAEDLTNFVTALRHGPFRPDELFPLGVRLHVVDCYLPELAVATGGQIDSQVVLRLAEPFAMLLAHSHLHSVANHIESSIFNNLLFKYDRSRADPEEAEGGVFFPVDKAAFTGLFNELASSPVTVQKKRRLMYQLRRLFENTESTPTAALPAKRKVAPAAASASKRQKQQTADESDEQASSTAPAEAPPAKKQKKKPQKEVKRKKQLPIEPSDPQEDEEVGVWLTPAAPTKQPAQGTPKKIVRKPTPGNLKKVSKGKDIDGEVELTPHLMKKSKVFSPKSGAEHFAKLLAATPSKNAAAEPATPEPATDKRVKPSPPTSQKKVQFNKKGNDVLGRSLEFHKNKKLPNTTDWKDNLATSPKEGIIKKTSETIRIRTSANSPVTPRARAARK